MNPALYTKWLYKYNNEETRIKIAGIWGKGSKDNYQVTAYELQHDDNENIDLVAPGKLKGMIADGKLTFLAPGPDVPK